MVLTDNTLAQIVTLRPAAAAIFENYDLDYCCRGKQTLKEACNNDFIKLKVIEQELEKVFKIDSFRPPADFREMPLSALVDYIVNKHHAYVKESIPRITAHVQKVSSKHGVRHPELPEIDRLFSRVSEEMRQHMYKEEHILFPRIKEIAGSTGNGTLPWLHERSYLSAPIYLMESEHESAGNILHEIRSLTRHFTPPADACVTFKITYHELNEFENDLHRHIHLENNILFPKALELFKKAGSAGLN